MDISLKPILILFLALTTLPLSYLSSQSAFILLFDRACSMTVLNFLESLLVRSSLGGFFCFSSQFSSPDFIFYALRFLTCYLACSQRGFCSQACSFCSWPLVSSFLFRLLVKSIASDDSYFPFFPPDFFQLELFAPELLSAFSRFT